MTMIDPSTPASDDALAPTGPRHAGSPQAIAVLLALAEWKMPCKHSELAAITGIPGRDLSHALKGLSDRGLAVCDQRGPMGSWYLSHWPNAPKGAAS